MAQVSNLKIRKQNNGDEYFATWDFNEYTSNSVTTGTGIKVGSLVSISSDATYYNGVGMPDWVKNSRWYVSQISGDRAVIDKDESGAHRIMSPVNTKYLSGVVSTTSTSKTHTLDHYEVLWWYDTGDGIWFNGSSSDVHTKQSTYSAPSNAIKIRCNVKPYAKTHKVNDTDVVYWTGIQVAKEYSIASDPPEDISTPEVKIEKYKLTASLENIKDAKTDKVAFEVYNGTKRCSAGVVKVLSARATYSCHVDAGGEYRVRCRAINLYCNSKIYGKWSDFSSASKTIPSTPRSIISCKASSKTSIYLSWTSVQSATSYDIEYATKKEYFDGSDQTTITTGIEFTHYEKTGLDTGSEYFFRVRATNDQGSSAWSEIKSVTIGTKPSAPTTWSSSTTIVSGEQLNLYWVHNSADGSSQTYAELELTINGVTNTYTIKNTENEDEKDKTSQYTIDTTKYTEGSNIKWRVRTAGVTLEYGDWSVQRLIDIYAPATLSMSITNKDGETIDTLTSFPFYISALAGPNTQAPISYHLTIKSNEVYETIDQVGNVKMVNNGEEIYSEYFDTSESLLVEMSASNLDLSNNISYTITCIVSMNSGLTAEAEEIITVNWTETQYTPDAEISIDSESYSAYIRPYCVNSDGEPNENVLLSVYRREFDGSFIELASNLNNGSNIHITDPHPALDYARYRIVAIDKTTGAVSYYDPPGYPILGKAIIIQWDESWSSFDTINEDSMVEPAWVGSLLSLPYNVDVSDNSNPDVELVEYDGRSHPVSYYGTQLGSTATWNVDIPKSDKDTLYALRRLSIWRGDVYVREPSGSGYWANVTVSFNQKHKELTIPISFNITRVEGGV